MLLFWALICFEVVLTVAVFQLTGIGIVLSRVAIALFLILVASFLVSMVLPRYRRHNGLWHE